jgi:hypothetical protein
LHDSDVRAAAAPTLGVDHGEGNGGSGCQVAGPCEGIADGWVEIEGSTLWDKALEKKAVIIMMDGRTRQLIFRAGTYKDGDRLDSIRI